VFNNPRVGANYAAEFQSSGLPFVTSSTVPAAGSPARIDFPNVTRFITVSNRDTTTNTMSVGFTLNGVKGSNKYVLNPGQAVFLELRVRSIWLQGESGTPAFSLCAGLTAVSSREMSILTGTLDDGSVGWAGVG